MTWRLLQKFIFVIVWAPLSGVAASLSFNPPTAVILSSTDPSGMVVADFNGDRHADMAIAMSGTSGGDGSISLLLGDGRGGFSNMDFATGNFNPWGIASGDFNGDGFLDLAVTTTNDAAGTPLRDVNILLGNGTGTFALHGKTSALQDAPRAVVSGDFNGDLKLDLLVGNQGAISLHLGNGNGSFRNGISVPDAAGLNASHLATGDFNNDGHLDFVSSEAAFLGDGLGGFTRKTPLGSGGAVAVRDVNNDLKLDIVSISLTNITVWTGNGDGTFGFNGRYDTKLTLSGVAIADFNGDGHPDVAVAATSTNQLAVLFGSTSGALSAPVLFAAGVKPVLVAAADWNEDQRLDIAAPYHNLGETPYVTVLTQRAASMAPTAVDDAFSVASSSSNNLFNVLANDVVSGTTGVVITALSSPGNGSATLNTAADSVLYTPVAAYAGSDRFGYTLRDSTGAQSGAVVTVTVAGTGQNHAPVATADAFNVVMRSRDNQLNVLANDTDADGNPLTLVSVGAGSNGGTITISGGVLLYTPAANYSGTETFSYTIQDSAQAQASALVTVTVSTVIPPNHAPNAVADSYTVIADSRGNTLDVLANDTDPDNDPLTLVSVGARSNGGTVAISAGVLMYTPAAGFAGTETFIYTIQDTAQAQASALVSVKVGTIVPPPINRAPVASADSYTVNAGSSANSLNVLSNDSDPDSDPLTLVSLSALSNGGTASISAGVIMYTPAAGFAGTETFSYTIRDSALAQASALVTITVSPIVPPPINRAPVASADSYTVNAGSSANSLNVLANDSDPDSDPLTLVSLSALSNGGTASISAGVIMYTPAAGFAGTETFSYTIRDSAQAQASAVVTVSVTPATVPTPVPIEPTPAPSHETPGNNNRKHGSGSLGLLEWLMFVLGYLLLTQRFTLQKRRYATQRPARGAGCAN